jgi:hypothetical protein
MTGIVGSLAATTSAVSETSIALLTVREESIHDP